MSIERPSEPGQSIDPIPRSTALLQPRDHRLRRAHAVGQLTLAQASLGSQVIDQLPERKIYTRYANYH